MFNKFMVPGKMQQAPAGASILCPINSGLRMIVNFVSLGPKFDQKLDKMLERVWNRVRQDYFSWSGDIRGFKLGAIKDTLVASDLMILNLLVRDEEGIIDADALEKALQNLSGFAKTEKGSIHISQLLIDEVPALKDLVKKYISDAGIHCYFYDLPAEKK